MAVGLHTTNLANAWLNTLSNTSYAASTTAMQLHTGDPGAAGTANASAETDRQALTWSAASGGSKAITATLPSWASWDAGAETISHVSTWDSVTAGAGNFLYSFALTASKAVTNGDTLNITSHTISLTPLAS